MRVLLRRWNDCRPDLARAWLEIRRRNPALASPYFHPKFAEIIAQHRDNVEVAQISETGLGIDALFVFQRTENNVGVPVGHFLSDYHGLICAPGFRCDPHELLRRCKLTAFDFGQLPISDLSFSRFAEGTGPSLRIDLSDGFGSYSRSMRAVKSEQIKIRRIERDIGALRFAMHDDRESVLETLLRWKEEQYKRTGVINIFVHPWVARVLRDIYRTQLGDFAGVLSSLHAGDVLVAAHLGMRSTPILHHWFPAYEWSVKTYSPGLILLLKMLEHAPAAGLTLLDLGQGTPEWKTRFANAEQTIAYGSVERWSLRYVRRATRRAARAAIIAVGLEEPARRFYAHRAPRRA